LDCLIYWTSQSPFDGRFAVFFEQFVDRGKGLGTKEAAMGRQWTWMHPFNDVMNFGIYQGFVLLRGFSPKYENHRGTLCIYGGDGLLNQGLPTAILV